MRGVSQLPRRRTALLPAAGRGGGRPTDTINSASDDPVATVVLIGGAAAGAEFSVDHISTLWGKRIVGVLGAAVAAGS